MKITLICVGSIKENYLKDAVNEYKKRLTKYCELNIIELEDKAIGKDLEKVKKQEGEEIIKKIPNNSYVIACDEHGLMLNSVDFANKIDEIYSYKTNNITFIIGGSLGISKEVLEKCDYKLSFSKMTFLHQFARVFLLEQIYRSFKILHNETYHK